MNKIVFSKNRKRLMEKLPNNSLVVLFAGKAPKKSADENYQFTPNRNFYYFTGIDEEEHIILISKINNDVKEILFLKEIDEERERWVGKTLRDYEAKEISNVSDIRYMNEFKNEGYNIDYKTASYFVDYVGDNVDILLSEINKMIIYKDSSHDILIEDINDICCKVIKDNIFELCNGIIQKDYKKIFEIYNDLMNKKEISEIKNCYDLKGLQSQK